LEHPTGTPSDPVPGATGEYPRQASVEGSKAAPRELDSADKALC